MAEIIVSVNEKKIELSGKINQVIEDMSVEDVINKLLSRCYSVKFGNEEFIPEIEGIHLGEDSEGKRMKFFDHQLEGIRFISRNKGSCILADDMGCGKTLQALAYTVLGKRKTLVICPACAKNVWATEIELRVNGKYTMAKDGKHIEKSFIEDYESSDYYIVNYDLLPVIQKVVHYSKIKLDLIICDESHYIKEVSSLRSKMVRWLSKSCNDMLLMSGTPIRSKPMDMYLQLKLVRPNEWKTKHDFGIMYCDAKQRTFPVKGRRVKVWTYDGATNLDNLQEVIKPYYLRRTKSQILHEIPPKVETLIPVDLPTKLRDQINDPIEGFKSESNQSYTTWLVAINQMRQISSEYKIDYTQERSLEFVKNGEKIIIYVSFLKTFDTMCEFFDQHKIKYAAVQGETSIKKRKEEVDKFQNDPECKVFIGSILATKESITLTEASCVFVHDIEWVPSDISQALDRACRIGQNKKVRVYYHIAKDTYENLILERLIGKQKVYYNLVEQSKEYYVSILKETMDKIIKEELCVKK